MVYIMYVDESGDPGAYNGQANGNSEHFILSGLIIPMEKWNECFKHIKEFRRELSIQYGLAVYEELHASELVRINKTQAYRSIKKRDRLHILTSFLQKLPVFAAHGKVINVCLKKTNFPEGTNVKGKAWERLIQRYDTFLRKQGEKVFGVMVTDGLEDKEVRSIFRRMRVFNPIPSRFGMSHFQQPVERVLEDPFVRDSKHSYFIQAADAIAYALYRKEYPKGSLKKYGVEKCFDYLEAILLKEASSNDVLGIVRK